MATNWPLITVQYLNSLNFRHFCEMSEIQTQRSVFRCKGLSEIQTLKNSDFRQIQISGVRISEFTVLYTYTKNHKFAYTPGEKQLRMFFLNPGKCVKIFFCGLMLQNSLPFWVVLVRIGPDFWIMVDLPDWNLYVHT